MNNNKKELKDYNKYLFFGAGKMAEFICDQLECESKLVGCVDTLKDNERSKDFFRGVRITSPDAFSDLVKQGDIAIIICVNVFFIPDVTKLLIETYDYPKDYIFITNPYTSCRPCVINEEFAKDKRLPIQDKRYGIVRNMFNDGRSLRIFDMLMKSKTYDYLGDAYELINVNDVDDLLWWSEDYWESVDFQNTNQNEATVLDCGAYIGDSIQGICSRLPYREIYYHAFEPVMDNVAEIKKIDATKFCKELVVHPAGVGGKTEEKSFVVLTNNLEGGYVSNITSQEASITETIRILSLDEANINVRGKLFIKMDIEGAELDALKGGRKLIYENRPYLAICLYHRKNDIIDIPLYLNSFLENYDFYLEGGYHTILIGVPK